MPGFLTKLKKKGPPSPPYIPSPLECPKCTFTTHERRKLQKHLESQHSPNSPKLVNCPKCEFKTYYKSVLQKHIESQHSPNYAQKSPELVKCPHCNVEVSDLNNHIQNEHEEVHEAELMLGYPFRPLKSKGGKRRTHYKRRSRSIRKTKRKTQRRK